MPLNQFRRLRNKSIQAARFALIVLVTFLSDCLISEAHAQGTYPKIEASFTLNTVVSDPFDYSNDLRVLIVQPDASTVSLPAFFDGGTTWRVRHTPTMSGVYSVSNISLNGSAVSFSNLQPASWTVTGFPTSPGFVRVDPADPLRFVTSNGRRYFPVGEDLAWSSPSSDILNIIPKMGAAHENWARIWMTHFYDNGTTFGLNLDWPKVNNTFGQLSLTNAGHWDAIIAAAEHAGVHVQVTLQHHGQYSSTNGSDTDPNWEQNPYNVANGGFLAHATNFFTDPMAMELTKRKLRYIVARWGYSTSVMGWELFNEVQFTDAAYAGQWTNIESWHNTMATFLRSQDYYRHLITSSSDLTEPIWDETDYYQHHDYPSDLISGIQGAPTISASQRAGPDYSGECGIDFTPHVGLSPPLWAGIMAAQSADAMPWYWDTIDPNNDYFLLQAAADFVTASGIADEDVLAQSTPATTGGGLGPLIFAFSGGFDAATEEVFTVGDEAPAGAATAPPYLQGDYHLSYTPTGYTFNVNYTQAGTFSVQILDIAQSGAGLQISLDGTVVTNISFPATASDTSTNFTASIAVPAGQHSINLFNPGLDWVLLGKITLNPYVPSLSAYAISTNNWQAVWVWNNTNIFSATPGPAVSGAVAVAGLSPGTYAGTWWDTFGAGAVSNFTFTVSSGNTPVLLGTPPVLRSMALYIGIPARAAIVPPNLTQTVYSNSAPFILPLSITNSGGLPLSYAVTFTNALPAWLSISSTNGTVSKSGTVTLSLAFNPAGLAAGTYQFTIFVQTGDPLLPVTTLPVTLTVASVAPAAPQLQVVSESTGQFIFQLQGSANASYAIQTSTNLISWLSVSTNTLSGSPVDFTNVILPGPAQQFWRALWPP
jgi:hypothetical protein